MTYRTVVGVGFRKEASKSALLNAITHATAGTPPPEAIATPEDKSRAQVILAVADVLALPVIAVDPSALEQAGARVMTQSLKVAEKRNVGSVAEAAALAVAGSAAGLAGPRIVSDDHMATAAVAVVSDQ